jgi:hypothetical protein
MNWTHESVFAALIVRAGRVIDSHFGSHVRLYEQEPSCAVLFAPQEGASCPIRLYPDRQSWRDDIYQAILPAIEAMRLEQRDDPKQSFICCSVRDWNQFARLLRLEQ